jgi:hypothetical protein
VQHLHAAAELVVCHKEHTEDVCRQQQGAEVVHATSDDTSSKQHCKLVFDQAKKSVELEFVSRKTSERKGRDVTRGDFTNKDWFKRRWIRGACEGRN